MLSRFSQIPSFSLLLKAATLAALSYTSLSHAEFDLQLGFSSEYVRQGIKASSSRPVAHTGITYSHQTGLYTGTWATQVNHKDDDTQFEIDYYGGWYLPITTSFATDLSYTRYTFHGDKTTNDQAYGEGSLSMLFWDSLTLGYRYANNFKDSNEDLQTLELAHTYNGEEFGFEFSMRQYRYMKVNEDVNFGSKNHDDYFHFRFGVGRSYGSNDMSLSLERTNLGKEFDGNTQILFDYNYHFNF